MIAGKQEAVAVQQHTVARGVTRRWDHAKVPHHDIVETIDHDLCIGLGLELLAMDNALSTQYGGLPLGVGDVDRVRQDDALQSAKLLDAPHEPRQELQ